MVIGILVSIASLVIQEPLLDLVRARKFGEVLAYTIVHDLIIFAISIWALIGIWRSASAYYKKHKLQPRRFWAIAAQIACVLGWIRVALAIFQEFRGFAQIAEVMGG